MHGRALTWHKVWVKRANPHRPAGAAWLDFHGLFVMVTWVPFRAKSFRDTMSILKSMAGFAPGRYNWISVWLFYTIILCVIAHFVGWLIERRQHQNTASVWTGWLCGLLEPASKTPLFPACTWFTAGDRGLALLSWR